MYSRLNRLIVLVLMLLCLPLNGLAALTMPACAAHDQASAVSAAAGDRMAMHDCEHHAGKQQSGKTPCDKCLSCHMLSAQAIPLPAFAVPELHAVTRYSVVSAEKPQPFSSSLFRPPIATGA